LKIIKILAILILTGLLTIITQIGGIVYLFSFLTYGCTNKKIKNHYKNITLKLFSFICFYLISTFVFVPIIAKQIGRVPLPIFEKNYLKPLNILTCVLNRNYVLPEMRTIAFQVADEMNKKYPKTKINYLDANFPFIKKFPLFPHLSHNDGKKLDLSFFYLDFKNGQATNDCPSIIGYGICEESNINEINTAEICEEKRYWQYSILKKIIPQGNKKNFVFDELRTKEMVNIFASKNLIGKLFIEPHLKARLKLTSSKIVFHGCQAVRHDDHLHVQLK